MGQWARTLNAAKMAWRTVKCGEDLRQEPVLDYVVRQVYDLPSLQLECTENRAEVKECPACQCHVRSPFAPGVEAPFQYGKHFRVTSCPAI
jgi:hypothetical protein